MSQTIQWLMTTQVPNGVRIIKFQVIEREAYDSIKLTVDENGSDLEEQLQLDVKVRSKCFL